jgi:diguanylate cyclase (GGDEF)-like protein
MHGAPDPGSNRGASSGQLSPMDDRDRTADDRDKAAAAHDASAASRDARSEDRDVRAEDRDAREGIVDVQAAADRAGARRDRKGAASDRKQAEDDRDAARVDRSLSAVQRAELLYDDLTGAYGRDAGLAELGREIVKARTAGDTFTIAFIDVDGLKAVNDAGGHVEGDRLLACVAEVLKSAVGDDDVVVRYGGDEFICGIAGEGLASVSERFARARADLEGHGQSASVGIAELLPDEDLPELIDRADREMYKSKTAGELAKG